MSRNPGRSAAPAASQSGGSSGRANPPQWLRPVRSWVHRKPAGPLIWKTLIAVLGAAVVIVGILLIPLPGPGWAIVFLGLAVWATEFVWAQRLLRRGQKLLREWTDWLARQSLVVRGLAGLLGLVVLAGLGYLGWRFLR